MPRVSGTLGATADGLSVATRASGTVEAEAGLRGWSPLFRVETDSARRVLYLFDWTAGAGDKPTATGYVGSSGLVTAIADGIDIAGSGDDDGGISEYATDQAYEVGDVVWLASSNQIYRCTTAISTGEAFTGSKWQTLSSPYTLTRSGIIDVVGDTDTLVTATRAYTHSTQTTPDANGEMWVGSSASTPLAVGAALSTATHIQFYTTDVHVQATLDNFVSGSVFCMETNSAHLFRRTGNVSKSGNRYTINLSAQAGHDLAISGNYSATNWTIKLKAADYDVITNIGIIPLAIDNSRIADDTITPAKLNTGGDATSSSGNRAVMAANDTTHRLIENTGDVEVTTSRELDLNTEATGSTGDFLQQTSTGITWAEVDTDLIITAYTTAESYSVGELVYIDRDIYRCTTAISSAPATLNTAHWVLMSVPEAQTVPNFDILSNSIHTNQITYSDTSIAIADREWHVGGSGGATRLSTAPAHWFETGANNSSFNHSDYAGITIDVLNMSFTHLPVAVTNAVAALTRTSMDVVAYYDHENWAILRYTDSDDCIAGVSGSKVINLSTSLELINSQGSPHSTMSFYLALRNTGTDASPTISNYTITESTDDSDYYFVRDDGSLGTSGIRLIDGDEHEANEIKALEFTGNVTVTGTGTTRHIQIGSTHAQMQVVKNGGYVYLGVNQSSTAATSDTTWRVMRGQVSSSGTVTNKQFADGNEDYDNAANNMPSLTYADL